jgi:hypothetical protein
MRWLALAVRASGLLLVASAALKAVDFDLTASAFMHYGLPHALAPWAVAALCGGEFLLGAWAMARPTAAAPVTMLLFTGFTAWHASMAVFGDDDVCPCLGFSVLGSRGPQAALAPVVAAFAAGSFLLLVRTRPRSYNPDERAQRAPESDAPPK